MSEVNRLNEQQKIAYLLQPVNFWKPHWRFVADLVETCLDGDELSEDQEAWLRHYAYKYRDQIIERCIKDRQADDRFYDEVDDVRGEILHILEECEPHYQELKDVSYR